MTQVEIDNGDLRFIFNKYTGTPIVYRLDNGGELEFVDEECVGLVLPNFEQQLNRGTINNIELEDSSLNNDDFIFNLIIDGQNITGRINLSSLDSKI